MILRLQSTKVTIRTQNLATQNSQYILMESPFIESQMHLVRSVLWRKKKGGHVIKLKIWFKNCGATVFATISQIKFGMKTYRVCKETNEIEARNAVVCLPSGENLLNRISVRR
jgi:hypothetical protein